MSTRCTWLQRLVAPPESRKRLVWDLIGLLVLTVDTLNTPLIAFKDGETTFDLYLEVITTLFWTLDIILSFFVGFNDTCGVEMRPEAIAWRYIKGTFLFDLMIVMLDWTLVAWRHSTFNVLNILRSSKVVRLVRIFRWMRLMRVMKLAKTLDKIQEVIATDDITPNLFLIFKSLVFLMIINHFIACAWYAIGNMSDGPRWVEDVEGRGAAYRYATSLHWSVTQFTPASTDVNPRNAVERIFTIVVIMLAVALFSSFVSRITATMTRFMAERWRQVEQKDKIKRYISENGISFELSARIMAFISAYRFSARHRTHREDIAIFRALPKKLQLMIDWEVYNPVLVAHPLFANLSTFDAVGMLQICNTSMEEVSVPTCEELFHCGQQATAMFFMMGGICKFFLGFDDGSPVELDGAKHYWLSEAALWMRWAHQGHAFAVTPCDFLRLDAQALHAVIKNQPKLQLVATTYARLFKQRVSRVDSDGLMAAGDLDEDLPALQELAELAFATGNGGTCAAAAGG